MRHLLVICVAILTVLLLQPRQCEAAGTRKMIIGGALLIAGSALVDHGWNSCGFGNDNCGETEYIVGSAAVLSGTVLLIWGLVDHFHSPKQAVEVAKHPAQPPFLIGAAPVPGGFVAGVRLRF